MEKTNHNQRPEKKFRVGAVSASVWKRSFRRADGQQFEKRQVSLDRRYKDKNDQWQSTNTYDANDIPKAILALMRAYASLVDKNDNEIVEEEVA